MKKCISFTLCLLAICLALLPCLSGCGVTTSDVVPDGMQSATCDGADYRLYVPTTWNLNTAYGVSGAYYNLSVQSTVSVVKYPLTDAIKEGLLGAGIGEKDTGARLDWYFENELLPPVANLATGGVKVVEEEDRATVLGDVNARRYRYSANIGGESLAFLQVIGERNGAFYVFSYTADAELFESLMENVNSMLSAFLFADPYRATSLKTPEEDPDTPDGMQAVQDSNVAFRFYVPSDWTVNRAEGIFSAFDPEDRSSVSVVSYLPRGAGMSIREYFTANREVLERVPGSNFQLVSEQEDATLAGQPAAVYEYTYSVGGVTYAYRQLVTGYAGMFYTVTYTALPEHYEAHLSEWEAILSAFSFR